MTLVAPEGGAYSGLWIYAEPVGVTTIARGDEVRVTGEYHHGGGVYAKINLASLEDIAVLSSGNTLPAPTPIDSSVLSADETAIPWSAVLVIVSEPTVTAIVDGWLFDIDDHGSVDDYLYDWPGAYPDLAIGDSFESITGLVYHDASYPTFQWAIEPVLAEELVGYSAAE